MRAGDRDRRQHHGGVLLPKLPSNDAGNDRVCGEWQVVAVLLELPTGNSAIVAARSVSSRDVAVAIRSIKLDPLGG